MQPMSLELAKEERKEVCILKTVESLFIYHTFQRQIGLHVLLFKVYYT